MIALSHIWLIVLLYCLLNVYVIWFVFQKELAKLITLEQGKTLADAEGDVFRGLRESHSSDSSVVILRTISMILRTINN